MNRITHQRANRNKRPRALSVAAEWGRTFIAQTLIGVLLATVWMMLGLQ